MYLSAHTSFRSVDSYTRPNARCPVCDARVFFYQSPHGGKVFFDELGGDWPKHPCTDTTAAKAGSNRAAAREQLAQNKVMYVKKGWDPVVIVRVEAHPFSGYSKLRALVKGEEMELWTSCCDLREGAPAFCMSTGNEIYAFETIALLSHGAATVIGFTAYRRQMDFNDSRRKPKRAKRSIMLRVKAPQQATKNSKPRARKAPDLRQKTTAPAKPVMPNTAIAFAFERARSHQR